MEPSFNATYSCHSVGRLPGNNIEHSGKIIMPPSASEQLTRLNIDYPMSFKITNKKTNRITHCGVLEFTADETNVYLPSWMMQNLTLEEGNAIQIESVSLPVGTFAKFQPVTSDFLDINNTKTVLEDCLQTFPCLTVGDVISITHNQKVYELKVIETKPEEAVSITSCGINVEFATPLGFEEVVSSNPRKEDVLGDASDLKEVNRDNFSIKDLQLMIADVREKYTVAIETMLLKQGKLEIKQFVRECENMTVADDIALTIPDFKVPTKVEPSCDNVPNLEELKQKVEHQMGLVETLNKIKKNPISRAMLEL